MTPSTLRRRPRQLQALNTELFPPAPPKAAKASTLATATKNTSCNIGPRAEGDTVTDEALIAELKGRNDGGRVFRLWSGDSSDNGGDASAGDQSLVNILTWRTNHDMARVDRLFRQSGRMRDKWDEKGHRADGATYGEMTLQNADAFVTAEWQPWVAVDLSGLGQGPKIQDVTLVDGTVDERIAALLARIERLENLLADKEQQLRRSEERRLQLLMVQRNPNLRPGERNTFQALAYEVEAAMSRGGEEVDDEGFVKVNRTNISHVTGMSPKSVSTHTESFAEWGILEKKIRRGKKQIDLPNGKKIYPLETWVRFTASLPETYVRMAVIEPNRPAWGGSENATAARWRCPEHPQAEIIKTTILSCAECGRELARAEENLAEDDPEGERDIPSLGGKRSRVSSRDSHPIGKKFTLVRPVAAYGKGELVFLGDDSTQDYIIQELEWSPGEDCWVYDLKGVMRLRREDELRPARREAAG